MVDNYVQFILLETKLLETQIEDMRKERQILEKFAGSRNIKMPSYYSCKPNLESTIDHLVKTHDFVLRKINFYRERVGDELINNFFKAAERMDEYIHYFDPTWPVNSYKALSWSNCKRSPSRKI